MAALGRLRLGGWLEATGGKRTVAGEQGFEHLSEISHSSLSEKVTDASLKATFNPTMPLSPMPSF
jgi:hypothetical protein